MATDTFNDDEATTVAAPATIGRSRRVLLIALVLSVIGLVDHYLPLSAPLRTQVAAISMVGICGLGILTWLPKLRIELAVSVLVAGGLSFGVIVSSALLIVTWYTPDRAGVGAAAIALLLLVVRALGKAER